MTDRAEPIQSDVPRPGLAPLDLAYDLLERGNLYARTRKNRFRVRSSALKIISLVMSATATIILGLQNLSFWPGLAFSLVALVTAVNTLEPFFAWRSRWVLMEETQSRFYRLRDNLTHYVAANQPDELDEAVITSMFDEYQKIWDQLGERWLQYRRYSELGQ